MALPQRYVEKDSYTEEEYLRWEEDAPVKSEYVRGDIRAMSGGTGDHAAITFNVSVLLGSALRGSDCRGMSSDMKIRTGRNTFRYPDILVVCGSRRYHGRSRSVITNPILVVEVLSDSTETTDRGEKLHDYQTLDSLQHYLLVSQHEPQVELYTRKDGGHWDYLAVEGPDGIITLSALSVTLALADIYEGIDLTRRDEDELQR